LRVIQGGQERPTDRSDALDDYVDDEVFGIPPNLITGFLTGLFGASAGAISLIVFFHVREPSHYVDICRTWWSYRVFSENRVVTRKGNPSL
jgi:hypothetical protein